MSNTSDQSPEEPRARRRGVRGRRALAVVTVLAISTGAGACGSSDDDGGSEQQALSTDAYLERVNAAQTAFATNAAKLNLANPSSAKGFGNSLGDLNGLIDTLRKRLAAIPEPEKVSAQQDELVDQLRDYGTVIKQQKGALTSGDPQKAKAAAQKVGKASTEFSQDFDATIKQINENLGLKTSGSSQ